MNESLIGIGLGLEHVLTPGARVWSQAMDLKWGEIILQNTLQYYY